MDVRYVLIIQMSVSVGGWVGGGGGMCVHVCACGRAVKPCPNMVVTLVLTYWKIINRVRNKYKTLNYN